MVLWWSKAISPRAVFHQHDRERGVEKAQDKALQVAKEIVVKFVETGRISPANFAQYFSQIYLEVLRAISENTPYPGDRPDAD